MCHWEYYLRLGKELRMIRYGWGTVGKVARWLHGKNREHQIDE